MITLIAAIGNNNELGKNNDLIWHLPADLKRFKEITTGHYIIMGRNTYESIGKPLPNRISVIITRNKSYKAKSCIIVNSLKEALAIVPKNQNAFIIGGAQIYNESINIVDSLDICEVHQSFDADVFFPVIDKNIWTEIKREKYLSDDRHKYDYSFVKYIKK